VANMISSTCKWALLYYIVSPRILLSVHNCYLVHLQRLVKGTLSGELTTGCTSVHLIMQCYCTLCNGVVEILMSL
jgi:hypothetical protein